MLGRLLVTHAWQKRKKQAEGTVVEAEAEAEDLLSSRPTWVVDHNLADLWKDGLSEDMIPEDLRLTGFDGIAEGQYRSRSVVVVPSRCTVSRSA